jgi:hypothetical protein
MGYLEFLEGEMQRLSANSSKQSWEPTPDVLMHTSFVSGFGKRRMVDVTVEVRRMQSGGFIPVTLSFTAESEGDHEKRAQRLSSGLISCFAEYLERGSAGTTILPARGEKQRKHPHDKAGGLFGFRATHMDESFQLFREEGHGISQEVFWCHGQFFSSF